MTRIRIGTAGWSYEDWEGIVYPTPHSRGFHPLEFLARYIDCVEINSTFYRPASAVLAASWVRRVAAFPEFQFAVKLHQAFSHERKRPPDAAAVDAFKRGIEPLAAAGRLAALLIQFPWSFGFDEPNRDYLEALLRLFAAYALAVEVRQAAWDDPRTYALLAEHKAAFVNIDQPLIGRSLGPTSVVTNPSFAYVRLHGRNAKDWFRPGAGRDARYDYLYAKDELADWVGRIKSLASSSQSVFVITNNHYRGQALANALQIKNMTTGRKLEVPEGLLRQYPLLEEIVRRIKAGQKNLFDGLAEGPDEPEKDGPDGLVGT
jgi:uncharacterized protein YecE (DUF72 family)